MPHECNSHSLNKSVYENFDKINAGQAIPSDIRSAFAREAFSKEIPKTAKDFTEKLELVYSAAEGVRQKGFVEKKDLQAVAERTTNPGIKATAQIAVKHYDELSTLQPSSYRTLGGRSRDCNLITSSGRYWPCPGGKKNYIIGCDQVKEMSLYADEKRTKQYIEEQKQRVHPLFKWVGELELGQKQREIEFKRSQMQSWVDTYNHSSKK